MSQSIEIPEDIEIRSPSLWAKWPIPIGIGAAGLVATFANWGSNKEHMFFSYMFAFATVLSIALGCLGFVIIQHLVRAGWSVTVRRIAENGAMTLPVLGLLFIPIFFGMHELFPWTHENLDAVLTKKAPYLNQNFFIGRAVGYFVVWAALAFFFRSRSIAQDREDNPGATRSMWFASGFATLLFGVSLTFAAFDWVMSLQPHWFSTIFGVYFFAGSMLGCFSFMTLVAKSLQAGGFLKTAITTEHYHDFGKWLFGFTVFWAYIGFSQFFLIWYGNIPEETEFYIHRMHHGWGLISWVMPVTNFFLPFFFLLSRHVKRHPVGLVFGAGYVMLVHVIDVYWLVMPNVGAHSAGEPPHAFNAVWLDALALLGVFGVFFGAFMFFMNRARLIPTGDPRLHEALRHQNY